MSRDPIRHLAVPAIGSALLFTLLVAGGLLYTSFGGLAREGLVTQMFINAIIVLGIQIYVGNTGVLSIGHIGFGSIAGYAFAVCAISPKRKGGQIPDAPWNLAEVDLTPLESGMVAVGLTVIVAFVIGLGLARSGAQSGAVAATVITLALLFVVHEVARNWIDLTRGGKTGLSFSPLGNATLQGRGWVYILLAGSILVARLFRESRTGRLAQAAREDDLAARSMGISPPVQQMVALVLSVAVVSAGSALRVFELGSINPRLFFFDYTLLTLTMLIVGGRSSVSGALAGVVIITAGSELTRQLSGPNVEVAALDWLLREGLTDIFLGGAMLGFMILRPSGLFGDLEVDRWLMRFSRRREIEPDRPPVEAVSKGTLTARGVTVDFGGFRALDGVTIEASTDEIVGLIGPNGAGKTTLLNVVTGLVEPSSGSVEMGPQVLDGTPAHEVARAGVVRTFQNLRLFGGLTVRENLEASRLIAQRHRADRPQPPVAALVVQAGLWELRDRRASQLDYGNARRLELARAAAAAPDFLFLDEPTSGMGDAESVAMIEQVRAMASMVGAGVVVIDHDLNFITGICDRIYVLDQGLLIAAGTPEEVSTDPVVQAAYLGASAPANQ